MAPGKRKESKFGGSRSNPSSSGSDSVVAESQQRALPPLSAQEWQGYGIGLLIIAAIFAITAMEAPFYFVDDRPASEIPELAISGIRPIHPEDVHIGAPWRWFGISVLWYVASAWAAGGVAMLVYARRMMQHGRSRHS